MAEVPDLIKSRVRAFLLSCTNHKEPMFTFEANYGKLYKKLNLKELGFSNLQSFMNAIPDAVSIQREGSTMMLVGIPTEQNKHIVDMIEKQKKPKKKPMRDSMILPRFQPGGRSSYPNSAPRSYRPPPFRFKQPQQPFYMQRPPPRPAPPLFAPQRFYAPPKPAFLQDRTNRHSVHDRLGPHPAAPPAPKSASGISSLEKARRRVEAAKEAAREKEMALARQKAEAAEKRAAEAAKRRPLAEIADPLEIRIDGEERTVSLKAATAEKQKDQRVIILSDPPSSASPPAVAVVDPVICEVDSDATSDESFEFPDRNVLVDADFLRMLVFYVISEADTDRNWVSASGLGSRMRRRLAKAGVETPAAIAESILKFMQYEWKDMFDAYSGDERGDYCHLNTPFKFCPAFREAYSAKVEPLEPQLTPTIKETMSVRIVHVDAPAFFVRLIDGYSDEMFVAIGEELSKEFLASEPSCDVFTYRKNEMCAVCVEIDGDRVWRRGRLVAFTLLGDELDDQTSELTAFVKVFLVDSGEVVNVRAGDVRPLPRRLLSTQALAYRCVFQGAHVDDTSAFDGILRKYLNEQVELQAHGEQISEGLMTLQVRIQADSYLLDDLVYAKVAMRVTCGDPNPPAFPPDTNVDVQWLGWRDSCRSALVKLNHPEQEQRLHELEVKLSEAVAGESSVDRGIRNNIYVWRRPSDLSRRVRCMASPSDGLAQVYCLDHGCLCAVTPDTDLCLPTAQGLMSLMSGTHYFTSVLRLALLPPSAGEHDVVRKSEALRQRIQGLCQRRSAFVARHETLMSESPSFMLYPRDDTSVDSSLNCALLKLVMDMRLWPAGQDFCANVRSLAEINPMLRPTLPDAQCLVLRLDGPKCRPSFDALGREFRYLQRCCLDFTAKAGDSVMCRLSDLPDNKVLHRGTRVVYRQIDPDSSSSLMCRVELHADYVGGSAVPAVDVEPIDDPLLSIQMQSAPPDLLFTVPTECFGARPLERFSDDLEPKELELFCELLQFLPAVDQLAITTAPESSVVENDVSLEGVCRGTESVLDREFPIIVLRTAC